MQTAWGGVQLGADATGGGGPRGAPRYDQSGKKSESVARGVAGGDRLQTQVYTLKYTSANQLMPVLRPIISPNNTIAAFPGNNSLVITDYGENLRRIERIIEAIEGGGMEDVEAVGNLRAATVVFRLDGPEWRADGRALFNLNPAEAIAHFHRELETIE